MTPGLAGVKVTGTFTMYSGPGLTGRPAATGSGVPNGTGSEFVAVITAGRLPVFVTVIVLVACWPTGTEPKLSDVVPVSVGVTSATPVPVSGICNGGSASVVTVSVPASVSEAPPAVPVAVGW